MKPVSLLMFLILLATMASCGKDNKSGKNRGMYGLNQLNSYGAYNGSSINYQGVSVQRIVNENPCRTGYNQRFRITTPVSLTYRIPLGDVYVGVTYSGDVGVLVGTQQGPVLEAYLCGYGQSQVTATGFQPLVASTCRIKQMNLTLVSPYGPVAAFGSMMGGSSLGRPFSDCQ